MPREIPPQLKAQKACLLDYKEGEAFSSGMSLKKLHEVEILGELIYQWNQTNGVNTLIDIGAGKGYISQVLQYFYGMNVIGLEGNDSHAQRADTRSANVQRKFYYRRLQQIYSDNRTVKEKMKHFQERPNTTITYFLDYNMNVADFDRVVTDCYQRLLNTFTPDPENIFTIFQSAPTTDKNVELVSKKEKMGLISLHGCGDLTCTTLDLFCKWDRAHTLVAVSCCYNKLIEERDGSIKGFPLSKTVRQLFHDMKMQCNRNDNSNCNDNTTNSKYEAPNENDTLEKRRENQHPFNGSVFGRLLGFLDLATESLAQWGTFNEQHVTQRLNTILFRSALEIPLRCFYPDRALVFCVRKMRAKNKFRDFEKYCKGSLDNLKVIRNNVSNRTQKMDDVSVLPNWNENRPIIQKMALEAYKEHTKNGNALMPWLTLQLALAPVLESLVILDRYLFLIEHANVEAEIVPVFDVVTSPRNLASTSNQSDEIHITFQFFEGVCDGVIDFVSVFFEKKFEKTSPKSDLLPSFSSSFLSVDVTLDVDDFCARVSKVVSISLIIEERRGRCCGSNKSISL
jgi:hypothetical protein